MSWSGWVRRIHRGSSIVFVAVVLFVTFMNMTGEPAQWVYLLPLAPLAVLGLTGLPLIALPYLSRFRSRGPSSA